MSKQHVRVPKIKTVQDHLHFKQDGTVSILVRQSGNKTQSYDVSEVNVSLTNRMPNVSNIVLYNLDRAIEDLTEIRDDIDRRNLYQETPTLKTNP